MNKILQWLDDYKDRMDKVLDLLRNELKVGDKVVFPRATSSYCCMLKLGTITKIKRCPVITKVVIDDIYVFHYHPARNPKFLKV